MGIGRCITALEAAIERCGWTAEIVGVANRCTDSTRLADEYFHDFNP